MELVVEERVSWGVGRMCTVAGDSNAVIIEAGLWSSCVDMLSNTEIK